MVAHQAHYLDVTGANPVPVSANIQSSLLFLYLSNAPEYPKGRETSFVSSECEAEAPEYPKGRAWYIH